MTILIADDDPTSRRILEAVLEKWGYDVLTARDGHQALEKIRCHPELEMAILDWVMPGMDGVQVCRKIRQESTPNPIYMILLTARGSKQDIVAGLQAGADDYIAKPFDNEELRARIEVGRRLVALQAAVTEKQRLQGALEMAGAVCHELNQPLQVISGYVELIAMDMTAADSIDRPVSAIREQITRIGELTGKLMRISRYQTKPYDRSRKIVDIDRASTAQGAM